LINTPLQDPIDRSIDKEAAMNNIHPDLVVALARERQHAMLREAGALPHTRTAAIGKPRRRRSVRSHAQRLVPRLVAGARSCNPA
jgi:hypothetical protein